MSINEVVDEVKVDLLNHQLKLHGRHYWFFYDIPSKVVYSQDKLIPLFRGLGGVPSNYHIARGYLSVIDADKNKGSGI